MQLQGSGSKVCSAKQLRESTTRSRLTYTDDYTGTIAGPVYDRLTDDEETFTICCFVSSETLLGVQLQHIVTSHFSNRGTLQYCILELHSGSFRRKASGEAFRDQRYTTWI